MMLWLLVIRPIGRLSQFADRVSLGELDIPDYKRSSGDKTACWRARSRACAPAWSRR
jgi:hypothetical protein